MVKIDVHLRKLSQNLDHPVYIQAIGTAAGVGHPMILALQKYDWVSHNIVNLFKRL